MARILSHWFVPLTGRGGAVRRASDAQKIEMRIANRYDTREGRTRWQAPDYWFT